MTRLLITLWLALHRESAARRSAESRLRELLHDLGAAREDVLRQRRAREAAEDEARQLRAALVDAMKGWEA